LLQKKQGIHIRGGKGAVLGKMRLISKNLMRATGRGHKQSTTDEDLKRGRAPRKNLFDSKVWIRRKNG